jgi:hypothetical protein
VPAQDRIVTGTGTGWIMSTSCGWQGSVASFQAASEEFLMFEIPALAADAIDPIGVVWYAVYKVLCLAID